MSTSNDNRDRGQTVYQNQASKAPTKSKGTKTNHNKTQGGKGGCGTC